MKNESRWYALMTLIFVPDSKLMQIVCYKFMYGKTDARNAHLALGYPRMQGALPSYN